MEQQTFTIEHSGSPVEIRLRLSQDAAVSVAEKMAAEIIVLAHYAPPRSVLRNESALNLTMQSIARRVTGPEPWEQDAAFPWQSWFEVDLDAVQNMVAAFITHILSKVERVPSRYIPGASLEALAEVLQEIETQ